MTWKSKQETGEVHGKVTMEAYQLKRLKGMKEFLQEDKEFLRRERKKDGYHICWKWMRG